MKKTENPYKALVSLQRKLSRGAAMQPTIGIGYIVSPPPNIKIKYNGYIVTNKYLWIDDYWLPGHTRHMVGATSYRGGGSGDPAYESHNHPIDNDEQLTDTWAVGDHVAMLPITAEDNRTTTQYIILGKLKRLDGN